MVGRTALLVSLASAVTVISRVVPAIASSAAAEKVAVMLPSIIAQSSTVEPLIVTFSDQVVIIVSTAPLLFRSRKVEERRTGLTPSSIAGVESIFKVIEATWFPTMSNTPALVVNSILMSPTAVYTFVQAKVRVKISVPSGSADSVLQTPQLV